MELKEWLTLMSLIVPFVVAFYMLGVKLINEWSKRNKEYIESIVDLKFNNKIEEMKRTYNEMISLLKGGTFK